MPSTAQPAGHLSGNAPDIREESGIDSLLRELQTNPTSFTLSRIFDAALERAERDGTSAVLPADFNAAVAAIGVEQRGLMYAQICDTLDRDTAGWRWAQQVLKISLEADLLARRKDRGPDDHAPIAIPHPLLTIENTVDFEPYRYDVDQIFEGLRGLPDDEIAKLLVIEPAHEEMVLPLDGGQIAALKIAIIALDATREELGRSYARTLESMLETHTVQAKMAVRNTGTLQAWLKKNAGSDRAKIVAQGVSRNITGSSTTIKPKTFVKRANPVVAQSAIDGAK